MLIRALAALALLAILPARAEAPPASITTLERDHPLVGKAWEPATGRFLAPGALESKAAAADAVLLGETHDNPDHHALQAWLVKSLTAAGLRPVVAFEMIDAGQGQALDRYLEERPADLAGLGSAIGWDKSGWPDWALYRPIAEAGASIRPANLSRDDTRALGRGQAPELAERLGVDQPLDTATQTAMEAEIKDSHCGMLPDKAVPAMVTVQRARDAVMAGTLAETMKDGDKAVLIAGTGHVRADRGVPWKLKDLAPTARVLAVAFIEVQADAREPVAYGELYGGALPFDVVMFTPRNARTDQCEEFRKHMQKKAPN